MPQRTFEKILNSFYTGTVKPAGMMPQRTFKKFLTASKVQNLGLIISEKITSFFGSSINFFPERLSFE